MSAVSGTPVDNIIIAIMSSCYCKMYIKNEPTVIIAKMYTIHKKKYNNKYLFCKLVNIFLLGHFFCVNVTINKNFIKKVYLKFKIA